MTYPSMPSTQTRSAAQAPSQRLQVVLPSQPSSLPETSVLPRRDSALSTETATADRQVPALSPVQAPAHVPQNTAPVAQFHRRWLTVAAATCAIGLAGFIQVPYQVGGAVQLEGKEGDRQSVHTPMPAVVDAILVETGDMVTVGQPLAQLSSPELAQQIADTKERLTRAYQELEAAQRIRVQSQASLLEASVRAQLAQQGANRVRNRLATGNSIPVALQSLHAERQRLQAELAYAEQQVHQFESVMQAGAVSSMQFGQIRQRYDDLNQQLQVNSAQIRQAEQQLNDDAAEQGAIAQSQAAASSAAAMVADSADPLASHLALIKTLDARLADLKHQQARLTLLATTPGTVTTRDLDLRVGQELKPDVALMEIVDLSELTAHVEVREEDLQYVEREAPVTFRPRQAKLNPYSARVDDISYDVKADNTQQRRFATVRVVINNTDGQLALGASGYARIVSATIPLYERVWREIVKLLPEQFL